MVAMKAVAELVLIILLCAGCAPYPLLMDGASAAGPPPNADWIITENTSISDQIINMSWNLTVKSGARLELRNVSLNFNFNASKPGGILVEAQASMLMENSYLNDRVSGKLSYFVVNGTLELVESVLNNIGEYRAKGGLQLNGAACRIRSSTFNPPYRLDVIYCNSSILEAENSDLAHSNNYNRAIVSQCATLEISNCTFISLQQGILANFSSVNITKSYFSRSSYGCCELHSSSARIIGCDFGGNRPSYMPPEGPIIHPAPEVLVQDCRFELNQIGARLFRDSYPGYSSCGIYVSDPKEMLIINDYFYGLSNGISTATVERIGVRSCHFRTDQSSTGIYCSGFAEGECLIEGNNITGGNPINVNSGAARIENNTITGKETYSSSSTMIFCRGPVEIFNNTIAAPNMTNSRGIVIDDFFGGDVEIAGNRLESLGEGILGPEMEGNVVIHDNEFLNCSSCGLFLGAESYASGNCFLLSNTAIYVHDTGYSTPRSIRILNSTMRQVQTGIAAQLYSHNLDIRGNDISSNISAIDIRGTSPVRTNLSVVDNRVTANGTGILLHVVESNPANSSVARNNISGCARGIDASRSRIDMDANSFQNISEWGIYLLDSSGNFSGAVSYFNASEPNACRMGCFWSLALDVKYNANGPGDPERWEDQDIYYIRVQDASGAVVLTQGSDDGVALKEYKLLADGSRICSNPYLVTAWMQERGVARSSLVMDSPKELELRLQKGPDLAARSLNMSREAPFEGELVFFCATASNDGSYNPNEIAVWNTQLRLLLDGNILADLEVNYFSRGILQTISSAWAATPGWHNISLLVVAPGNVTDVLPENNLLTRSFFVACLPDARITANMSNAIDIPGQPFSFNAWEPVNFSMAANSSDPVTAYRYDFGDGSASDWIASPDSSHVFSSAGEYTVRGWVATSRGAVRECAGPLRVAIYFPSTALELIADPDPAPSNRPILFMARIAARVGEISSAIWQFGDGGYSFGKDAAVTGHAYGAPGNYTVTLTVNTAQGGVLTGQMVIRVLNLPPTAAGKIAPSSGDATTVFSFFSESSDSDGQISACRWDLGDGDVSYSPRALHSYARHGVYSITLTVQDDQGDWSAPASFVITVNNTLPSVRMRAGRLGSAGADTYVFDGYGTSDLDDPAQNLSYIWDFGDGTTAEGINVSHAFSSAGGFQVTLTVEDGAGGKASRTITVHVAKETDTQTGWQIPALVGIAAVSAVAAAALFALYRSKSSSSRPGNHKNFKMKGQPPSNNRSRPTNNVTVPENGRSK